MNCTMKQVQKCYEGFRGGRGHFHLGALDRAYGKRVTCELNSNV